MLLHAEIEIRLEPTLLWIESYGVRPYLKESLQQ